MPAGTLHADPDRLAQALRNLVRNAIEHTAPQEGRVLMHVERAAPDRIRFVVQDDGPGIPEDQRELVFERFHRTDAARDRASGGTGLGLAIVKAIAEAHGGLVRATASAAGGAKIELELPGFQPARPATRAAAPADGQRLARLSGIGRAPAPPRWHDPRVLLYDSAVSGNCYKVRLLLSQQGIAFERREMDVVDRSGREELLGGLNPALRVPTLVLDDGEPLAESNAIICYLAEGTPMLPAERLERARVLQWLFFEQYSHEPYIAVVRFWELFAADPPPAAEIESRRRTGHVALAAMERHLQTREYLVGERYTVADIALYAYTHVAHEAGFEMSAYPAIAAWLARVAAQPGHVPITA